MQLTWKGFAVREARSIIDEWERQFGALTLPVPVDDIADLLCTLSIDITNSLPTEMAGRLQVEDRIIEVRDSDIPTRQRFTVAHEIGHYRLHVLAEKLHLQGFMCNHEQIAAIGEQSSFANDALPGFDVPMTPRPRVLSDKDKRRLEIEANTFGSELLMPARLIEEAVNQYGADVRELAARFDVSPIAMRYRLEKMLYIPSRGQKSLFD
jgi:Predicted Zn peptidase